MAEQEQNRKARESRETDSGGQSVAVQSPRNLTRYINYEVLDRSDSKIGSLECLWSDHTGEPAFLGVRTGWFFGKIHVVPAQSVSVNERDQRIRLPYDKDLVKDAPTYDTECEMDEAREWEIYSYYGLARRPETTSTAPSRNVTPDKSKTASSEATIPLSEEKLKVGKRQVEAGGVRLRKIIRTEVVNQPVELQREEIVIERVPPSEAEATRQRAFQGEEIYIPLRREEAVVEKQARVREEVRVRKETQKDQRQVSGEVRREDIEIEESGEARRTSERKPTAAEDIRKREQIPRSQRRRE
jgi:uncharacterized protein (TIGR02271 family)